MRSVTVAVATLVAIGTISVARGANAADPVAASETAQDPSGGSRVYVLKAVDGSGESGTIALKPRGMRTDVEIHLLGAPRGVQQDAHLRTGTCSDQERTPKFNLESVVDGTSDSPVEESLPQILAQPMAVDVDRRTNDPHDVACADVTP